MENRIYKPLVDKLFFLIFIPTGLFLAAMSFVAVLEPHALWLMIPLDLLILYFIVSPLFGYVELRGESVFIKFGFFMKREVAYKNIRGVSRERRFYSDSMLSLKNSFEHVNIKYNVYDLYTVSVEDNGAFIAELEERVAKCR